MPATRYGISPWMEHAPRPRPAAAPAFKGEVDAPLVIIGGGLTGVITAWACAQAGMKALLLDADRLGRGGTSLGSGLSPSTPGLSFREFSATAGRRAARAHFEQTAEAAADFTSTLRRLNRKVALETVDAWQVALFGQGAASLTAEAAARTDADLTASIKTAAAAQTATRLSVSAGVRVPGWITANPLDVLHAFATAATKKGVQIFERSPVTRIGFDRRLATVHTARGRITTTCVIHATGEPGPLSASLHRHFTPSLRPVVMTAAVPASARRILLRDDVVLIDDEAPAHAIRWTKDGRLMVSGADGARPAAAKNEAFLVQRTGQLMYELSRLYPDISGLQPARGWATPLSAFADAGVCAGPHRNFPHQLFGFAGNHDPVRAFLIARILARHATGRATKADGLMGFQRGSHR